MARILCIGNALVDHIVRIPDDKVLEAFSLPRGSMTLVDQDADRYFGSENVYYTRLVNAVAEEPLKLEILDTLFAVAAANGSICTREEAELRIIATGLFLSHDDYIRIRLRYREFLDVLK